MDRLILASLLFLACTKEPEVAVCGLHAASKPVLLEGKREVALSVGARLMPSDRIEAKGFALLECFGGALRVLDDEKVTVGDLKESKIEATTIPRFVLKDGQPVKATMLAPSMMPRYSDNRFTPASAFSAGNEPTSADYFKAFFTPNGIENMASAPREDGPVKLPPPSQRVRVARIHAGPLGQGGARLEVDDEVVFAETDDLATAALPEGHTYELGATVRLVLPDGAEATLIRDGVELELEGPMDLRLR
ncbi:MAG: hypothetical protein Q8K32_09770 [Archangium sp.]|nr:hypothetical protein [Archangium sp.]